MSNQPSLPILTQQPHQSTHTMATRSTTGTRKSNPKYAFSVISSQIPPTLAAKAIHVPVWRKAMIEEVNALIANKTWELVPRHSTQNVIGCKWLFRIKEHSDGSIDRFKARLVANGMHQREGADYDETFSTVIKPVAIHLVLSVAQTKGWKL